MKAMHQKSSEAAWRSHWHCYTNESCWWSLYCI